MTDLSAGPRFYDNFI